MLCAGLTWTLCEHAMCRELFSSGSGKVSSFFFLDLLHGSVLFVGCRENDPRYYTERPKLNPKLQAEQSIRIAKFALDYYIETKKVHGLSQLTSLPTCSPSTSYLSSLGWLRFELSWPCLINHLYHFSCPDQV